MATQMDRDAYLLLHRLAGAPRDQYVNADELAEQSALSAERLNDAVALLVDSGYVEWIQTLGSAPYDFAAATITSRGRYEDQRAAAFQAAPGPNRERINVGDGDAEDPGRALKLLPPSPIGSPYGFTDADWEVVSERKGQATRLYVVLGHQFESELFNGATLRTNVEAMLNKAVGRYNENAVRQDITLDFRVLNAGYGEHLFNEIARDIVGSDIAVFETSDLNPNVMLEMGVALTWGVRVLPIKHVGQPRPPSDVSGQTWADYTEDAGVFPDADHEQKLVRMIERAIRKKGA
jgi:hypothetical protein